MGQQQLLLLVLCLVIVGLSVVSGLDAYMTNRRKAEVDVVVERTLRVAALAQTWKMRPAVLGGGAGQRGFDGVHYGLSVLGWPTGARSVTGTNAAGQTSRQDVQCYSPDANSTYCPVPQWAGPNGELTIIALSNVLSATGTRFSSNDMSVIVTATVSGTRPQDIEVVVER